MPEDIKEILQALILGLAFLVFIAAWYEVFPWEGSILP